MRSFVFLSALFLTLSPLSGYAQDKPLQQSEHGWYLSPHGTIRILVLFVEVEYDVNPGKDPQPGGSSDWYQGQLPKWKDQVFDPKPLPQQIAQVSRYYQDISLGAYTVLGDYLDKVITLKESKYPGLQQGHSIGRFAVQEANESATFITHYGSTIEDLDLWKDGGKPGLPKETGPDEPHSFDHVMVMARNGALRTGTGSTDSGSPGKLFGHESDTQSRFGAMNGLPFEILKHEFNHLLLGGNNFHSGGGNAAKFESNFMNLQGGWSMMGAAGSSLMTCTGWDRDRLGWKPEGAVHRIRAHDRKGTEVNADLDPLNGDTGVFVLRDFVRSGDALRIKMPFIPADELQQWLWVENHQGHLLNGSPTDKFHWEGAADCIATVDPGLFMTMQVGRDDREGLNIYGGSADYLRPVLANGNFDLRLRGDIIEKSCLFASPSTPFIQEKSAANPFTGNHEQELPLVDRDANGRLQHGEHWVPGTRCVAGEPEVAVVFAGRPEHAFRMNGVQKLGMCTNPSSTNMHTLVSTDTRAVHGPDGPDVRVAYLNGISVELLGMTKSGEATVHVSINDTRLTTDQRWCADSIVLPPLRGTDGHSLTIATRAELRVDRSRTPTRLTEPDSTAGGPWFSKQTGMTVLEGASILVEDRGVLSLEEGSVLHLLPGSSLELVGKAALRIDNGSRLVVHPGARLIASQRALCKVRKKGRITELQ